MAGTMTWVGLDVHARSTYAAAIDSMTGELSRVRFGAGTDAPVAWLRELPAPVRACCLREARENFSKYGSHSAPHWPTPKTRSELPCSEEPK
jgi:hypothetical protein